MRSPATCCAGPMSKKGKQSWMPPTSPITLLSGLPKYLECQSTKGNRGDGGRRWKRREIREGVS